MTQKKLAAREQMRLLLSRGAMESILLALGSMRKVLLVMIACSLPATTAWAGAPRGAPARIERLEKRARFASKRHLRMRRAAARLQNRASFWGKAHATVSWTGAAVFAVTCASFVGGFAVDNVSTMLTSLAGMTGGAALLTGSSLTLGSITANLEERASDAAEAANDFNDQRVVPLKRRIRLLDYERSLREGEPPTSPM